MKKYSFTFLSFLIVSCSPYKPISDFLGEENIRENKVDFNILFKESAPDRKTVVMRLKKNRNVTE